MTDKSVHVLLGEVLAELPAIGKGSKAPAAMGGYAFRGIEDVLNALNPILSEKGLFVVPHDVVFLGEENHPTSGGKAQYNVRLIVKYRWYGPLGDFVESAACGEGSDSGDKATQKALTSAFKYMLFETLCISTEDGANSDIDRGHVQESTVDPMIEKERQFKAEGGVVPEGWTDFAEYDTAHVQYKVGLESKGKIIKDAMKAYRTEQSIPWPMTKAESPTFRSLMLPRCMQAVSSFRPLSMRG